MNLSECFDGLARGERLTPARMTEAMRAVMGGTESDDDIETFLRALQHRGVSADELLAAARVMRENAVAFESMPGLLDTCGTGADASGTLNLSTLAALTCAAAGLKVAKHGNRAVSGSCGSADLLEALGIEIRLPPALVRRSIEETGFGFFFAPDYHPAARHAAAARKRIASKTIFNLLGPLCNPARPQRQLVGVYDAGLTSLVAATLGRLGLERALVVHGDGGIDEVSLGGPTRASEWADGSLRELELTPESLGASEFPLTSLQCRSRDEALAAARGVLEGRPGPMAEAVAVNAGVALCVGGAARSYAEGVRIARTLLADGAVSAKTRQISERTRALAAEAAGR